MQHKYNKVDTSTRPYKKVECKLKLYRVTMQTSLLVEANNEGEAETIAEDNLVEEVRNGNSEFFSVENVQSVSELHPIEKGSLPWRDWNRNNEPELTVEEILSVNQGK